jgi:hypothetical protein
VNDLISGVEAVHVSEEACSLFSKPSWFSEEFLEGVNIVVMTNMRHKFISVMKFFIGTQNRLLVSFSFRIEGYEYYAIRGLLPFWSANVGKAKFSQCRG